MKDVSDLGSASRPLLSDEYRRLNKELHQRDHTYGTTGRKYAELVRTFAREYKARHILDYGCGKRDLWRSLHAEFDVRNFDPAIPGLDGPPEPADLVACVDVLEHVEPDYLHNVLADLRRVTLTAAFLTIAMRPASKHLPDGTNCHRIVEGSAWWIGQLEQHLYVVRNYMPDKNCLHVVLEPKAHRS